MPFSRIYAGGTGEAYDTIAEAIRSLLRLSGPTSDLVVGSVQAAVAQSWTVHAIRLLRLHKELSLTEAKAFIARLD